MLRWVKKGGNIGTGVDFLSALRHPGVTSVIALVFLTTSERSGDLVLLVIILSRREVGEERFGHNLGRLDKAISISTPIY